MKLTNKKDAAYRAINTQRTRINYIGHLTIRTFRIIFTTMFLVLSVALLGQGTKGSVDISVRTKPNGAKYSPKHVFAIWIEDAEGNFVKTIKLSADRRKEHLYTWNTNSGGNTTDAVTGSTLGSHTSHNASWDCTQASGALAEDGGYVVRLEYTSEHAQGPITSLAFTKATDVVTFQAPDETYFVEMDLVYTPASSTGISASPLNYNVTAYPNPASNNVSIKLMNPMDRYTSIKIYQSDMRLIGVVWDGVLAAGLSELTWNLHSLDGSKVPAGTYFMVVSGDNTLSTRKIVVK